MTRSRISPHTVQMTKAFAEGSFIGVVALVSAIVAATLLYVWLFT